MRKLVVVALIIGFVFGALNFILFIVFKNELYSNKVLLNTLYVVEIVIVFFATYFIFKRSKKD